MNPLVALFVIIELPGLIVGAMIGAVVLYIFAVLQNWGWIR